MLSRTGSIRVRGEPDYKEKGNPVMVAGKLREAVTSTPGEFYCPYSIAIDLETNNIFVCDGRNSRVQVFNEFFEFLFTFSEEMNRTVGICINLNRVYVTQFVLILSLYTLLKVDTYSQLEELAVNSNYRKESLCQQ